MNVFRQAALERAMAQTNERSELTRSQDKCAELQRAAEEAQNRFEVAQRYIAQLEATIKEIRDTNELSVSDARAEQVLRLQVQAENKRLRDKLGLTPNDSSLKI